MMCRFLTYFFIFIKILCKLCWIIIIIVIIIIIIIITLRSKFDILLLNKVVHIYLLLHK